MKFLCEQNPPLYIEITFFCCIWTQHRGYSLAPAYAVGGNVQLWVFSGSGTVARHCLGTEPGTPRAPEEGRWVGFTAPSDAGASETNSYKPHTAQGLSCTPTGREWTVTWGQDAQYPWPPICPLPDYRLRLWPQGHGLQRGRQDHLSQKLSSQLLICHDPRRRLSEKVVSPSEKDGYRLGARTGICYFLLNGKLCGFLWI